MVVAAFLASALAYALVDLDDAEVAGAEVEEACVREVKDDDDDDPWRCLPLEVVLLAVVVCLPVYDVVDLADGEMSTSPSVRSSESWSLSDSTSRCKLDNCACNLVT